MGKKSKTGKKKNKVRTPAPPGWGIDENVRPPPGFAIPSLPFAERGLSPLHIAATTPYPSKVNDAIERMGPSHDINERERSPDPPGGGSALHFAVQNGLRENARVLLQHGANPNLPKNSGATSIHTCVFAAGNVSGTNNYPPLPEFIFLLDVLIKYGGSVKPSPCGMMPEPDLPGGGKWRTPAQATLCPIIMCVSQLYQHEDYTKPVLEMLLRVPGVDPSAISYTGLDALQTAAYYGHTGCAELLVLSGWDPELKGGCRSGGKAFLFRHGEARCEMAGRTAVQIARDAGNTATADVIVSAMEVVKYSKASTSEDDGDDGSSSSSSSSSSSTSCMNLSRGFLTYESFREPPGGGARNGDPPVAALLEANTRGQVCGDRDGWALLDDHDAAAAAADAAAAMRNDSKKKSKRDMPKTMRRALRAFDRAAELLTQSGGASLAASYLADAMRQSPGLPTHQALVAMHNLCTVLTNAGRHYEAVLWARRLTNRDPNFLLGWFSLCSSLEPWYESLRGRLHTADLGRPELWTRLEQQLLKKVLDEKAVADELLGYVAWMERCTHIVPEDSQLTREDVLPKVRHYREHFQNLKRGRRGVAAKFTSVSAKSHLADLSPEEREREGRMGGLGTKFYVRPPEGAIQCLQAAINEFRDGGRGAGYARAVAWCEESLDAGHTVPSSVREVRGNCLLHWGIKDWFPMERWFGGDPKIKFTTGSAAPRAAPRAAPTKGSRAASPTPIRRGFQLLQLRRKRQARGARGGYDDDDDDDQDLFSQYRRVLRCVGGFLSATDLSMYAGACSSALADVTEVCFSSACCDLALYYDAHLALYQMPPLALGSVPADHCTCYALQNLAVATTRSGDEISVRQGCALVKVAWDCRLRVKDVEDVSANPLLRWPNSAACMAEALRDGDTHYRALETQYRAADAAGAAEEEGDGEDEAAGAEANQGERPGPVAAVEESPPSTRRRTWAGWWAGENVGGGRNGGEATSSDDAGPTATAGGGSGSGGGGGGGGGEEEEEEEGAEVGKEKRKEVAKKEEGTKRGFGAAAAPGVKRFLAERLLEQANAAVERAASRNQKQRADRGAMQILVADARAVDKTAPLPEPLRSTCLRLGTICACCGALPGEGRGKNFFPEFKKCSGCGEVYYCSRHCQMKDWKKGGHKKVCGK